MRVTAKDQPVGDGRTCAPFCAHPTSKAVALGSDRIGNRKPRNGAENQHDSKASYAVLEMNAATVNRRVASSNLARGAISLKHLSFFLTPVSF
jgi:hypothetical protein